MINKIYGWLGIFARGFAMGCADVVPGVSGGTIALITGIYERLIAAITKINLVAVALFFRGRWKQCWHHIDGNFLLAVAVGILSAIFTLAHAIDWLLQNQPLLVWSFFSGLILASALFILKSLVGAQRHHLIFLLLGILAILAISSLRADLSNPSLLVVFSAGFVAISAMLLPGVSGSFILLMLGLYQPTLDAVRNIESLYLLTFAVGACGGFLVFSRVIEFMLERFHHQMLLFLVGLLLGSLQATWPWKSILEGNTLATNITPARFAEICGSAEYGAVLGVFLAGLFLVIVLEWLGKTSDVGHGD